MTILRNLRRIDTREGPAMAADFTTPDGREGSVTVPMVEYQHHGEKVLELEAEACVRQSRRHGYVPPEADRFCELR